MNWIKTEDKLPPQGLKILYWDSGDCWVAWRFGKYWLPTVFADSKHAIFTPPELWSYIDFPNGFSGNLFFIIENVEYDTDSLEKFYPEKYKEVIEIFVNAHGLDKS